MDTSNLTLAPAAGHKTRQGYHSALPAESASQSPKAEAKVMQEVAEGAEALPRHQSAGPVDESEQQQNLVDDTLRKLNDLSQTSIAFSQHEETGRTVITVSDKKSGEQIRTIPSEDLLAIAAHLEESLRSDDGLQPGLLVSSKA
jgi:flagellar protein FlaG